MPWKLFRSPPMPTDPTAVLNECCGTPPQVLRECYYAYTWRAFCLDCGREVVATDDRLAATWSQRKEDRL